MKQIATFNITETELINKFLEETKGEVKSYSNPVVIEYDIKDISIDFDESRYELSYRNLTIPIHIFIDSDRRGVIFDDNIIEFIICRDSVIFISDEKSIYKLTRDMKFYTLCKNGGKMLKKPTFVQLFGWYEEGGHEYDWERDYVNLEIRGFAKDVEYGRDCFSDLVIGHNIYFYQGQIQTKNIHSVKSYVKDYCQYHSEDWVPDSFDQNSYYSQQLETVKAHARKKKIAKIHAKSRVKAANIVKHGLDNVAEATKISGNTISSSIDSHSKVSANTGKQIITSLDQLGNEMKNTANAISKKKEK